MEQVGQSPESAVRGYHEAEANSLEDQVRKGTLRVVGGSEGKLYTLPLETGDFPVAIVTKNGLAVRSGDLVSFKRLAPGGGYAEAQATVGNFRIDKGSDEILFTSSENIPSMLRTRDISQNTSASRRALDNLRDNVRNPLK